MTNDVTTIEHARELRKAGRPVEALRLYQAAMAADPLNLAVWAPAARAAIAANQCETAVSLLSTYTQFYPRDVRSQIDLAFAQFRLGQTEAATAAYGRVLRLEPDNILALCALGHLAYVAGDPERGAALHDRTLAVPAMQPDEHFVHSGIHLIRGDYGCGLPLHELRWEMRQFYRPEWRELPAEIWQGEELGGRTIYLHSEGGHGDTLMLARYVPLVAARGGRVVLSVQPALRRLLATVPGVADIADTGFTPDPDAVHQSLMSLPAVFGTTTETIPPPVTGLAVPADPLPPEPTAALRVGIVWAGEPSVTHDWDRSIPTFSLLQPLLDTPDVEWWSLQVGKREQEYVGSVVRGHEPFADFADTARAIAHLDLVITVDTAVGHLAGSMGKPVWVMVPTVPEYRWLLEGEYGPWYSNVRALRRVNTSAWPELIARAAAQLAEVVAGRPPLPADAR